jgi:hypothetical protein
MLSQSEYDDRIQTIMAYSADFGTRWDKPDKDREALLEEGWRSLAVVETTLTELRELKAFDGKPLHVVSLLEKATEPIRNVVKGELDKEMDGVNCTFENEAEKLFVKALQSMDEDKISKNKSLSHCITWLSEAAKQSYSRAEEFLSICRETQNILTSHSFDDRDDCRNCGWSLHSILSYGLICKRHPSHVPLEDDEMVTSFFGGSLKRYGVDHKGRDREYIVVSTNKGRGFYTEVRKVASSYAAAGHEANESLRWSTNDGPSIWPWIQTQIHESAYWKNRNFLDEFEKGKRKRFEERKEQAYQRRIQEVQLQLARKQEEEKQRKEQQDIMYVRHKEGRCVLCGKQLSILSRILRRECHAECQEFAKDA